MTDLKKGENGWTHRVEKGGKWSMECSVTCSCGLVFTSLVPLAVRTSKSSLPFILVPLITIFAILAILIPLIIKRRKKQRQAKLNLIDERNAEKCYTDATVPSDSQTPIQHSPPPPSSSSRSPTPQPSLKARKFAKEKSISNASLPVAKKKRKVLRPNKKTKKTKIKTKTTPLKTKKTNPARHKIKQSSVSI